MKKILSCFMVLLVLPGLWGCASQSTEPTVHEETKASEVQTEPMIEETEAAAKIALEGKLFLKASSVALSIVGETDDIYLGTLPREAVTWESDDETVVTFDNGVLQAVGVGNTTVRAIYGDQTVECAASCLARTEEELLTLDKEILQSPKRLPPEVDMDAPCEDFTESAIIGDSITYFLFQWESKYDYLGEVTFLCRGGVSLNGFVLRSKNIYYRGKEVNLEDGIAQSGVKRIYVMLGQNDISSKARVKVMDNWVILLERIREKSPDVEICIQSCIPQLSEETRTNEKNETIFAYNETLRQFAKENNCKFLDLEYYIRDHQGKMPYIYSQGDYHMNEAGCYAWMKILRYYAQYEKQGGILS